MLINKELELSPEAALILSLLLAEVERILKPDTPSKSRLTKTIGFRVDVGTHREIKECAKKKGLNVSQLMRMFARRGLSAELPLVK